MTIFISPGNENATPNQLRELQDALNAAGVPEKIIVLPPGSKLKRIEHDEDDLVIELLRQVRKGVLSIDDARRQLRLRPWGLPETGASA